MRSILTAIFLFSATTTFADTYAGAADALDNASIKAAQLTSAQTTHATVCAERDNAVTKREIAAAELTNTALAGNDPAAAAVTLKNAAETVANAHAACGALSAAEDAVTTAESEADAAIIALGFVNKEMLTASEVMAEELFADQAGQAHNTLNIEQLMERVTALETQSARVAEFCHRNPTVSLCSATD